MELLNIQKRLWAEIDMNAVEHNYNQIKGPVCCVVKANAYGHGAIQLAKLYEKLGVFYFAVSNIEEAIQLRNAGITKPILILGYSPVECVKELSKYNISQCVYSLDYANALSKECIKNNVNINIHIKIDTGMGRIGFQYKNNHNDLEDALKACKLEGFRLEGIFTHFAVSDEGINDYTNKQYNYFINAIEYFKNNGIVFKICHCANSAAIIDYPTYHLDMVRAGIMLYGVNPTNNNNIDLKPVLTLKSIVSNVKEVKKGDSISYGRTYIADKDMRVATIPIGYADGFYRSNTNNYVYINDKKCRILGRICMDQIMVESEDAKIGDIVEIYGSHIKVEDVAKYNHTIPYEILCSIGQRVPRVYIYNNEIMEIQDNLVK